MTKNEAIELENKCDRLMSDYTGQKCTISMSLSGRFKVSFDANYIILNTDNNSVVYLNYHGFYIDLTEFVCKAFHCIDDNKDLFDKIIWSYEHTGELKE